LDRHLRAASEEADEHDGKDRCGHRRLHHEETAEVLRQGEEQAHREDERRVQADAGDGAADAHAEGIDEDAVAEEAVPSRKKRPIVAPIMKMDMGTAQRPSMSIEVWTTSGTKRWAPV